MRREGRAWKRRQRLHHRGQVVHRKWVKSEEGRVNVGKHRLTPSRECVHANIWTCWEGSRVKDVTYGLFSLEGVADLFRPSQSRVKERDELGNFREKQACVIAANLHYF